MNSNSSLKHNTNSSVNHRPIVGRLQTHRSLNVHISLKDFEKQMIVPNSKLILKTLSYYYATISRNYEMIFMFF